MMAQKFVWKGLKAQVGKWAKNCEDCQAAKITRHNKAPPTDLPVTVTKFSAHNLVGPLTPSHGYTYQYSQESGIRHSLYLDKVS